MKLLSVALTVFLLECSDGINRRPDATNEKNSEESFDSYPRKMIIEGVYKGKNLIVQNPLINPEKEYGFCITRMPVVNGNVTTRLIRSGSFEIDLSYIKEGDQVYIIIEHHMNCIPKILNLEAIDGVVR